MNPLLETAGLIAAIIICLFILIFVILAVAFNVVMAFGLSWLNEKIQAIKMLRPTVESVNKATESALQGLPPNQNENNVIRTAASIPTTVHNLEKKVDQGTNKVAESVIEFRARTVQAKTILKAFFLPGLIEGKHAPKGVAKSTEYYYSIVTPQRSQATPIESPPSDTGDREQSATAEQTQHASIY